MGVLTLGWGEEEVPYGLASSPNFGEHWVLPNRKKHLFGPQK